MSGVKSHWRIILALALVLLLSSCSTAPASKVGSAADALDVVMEYLHENEGEDTPWPDIQWQQEDVTPSGLLGSTTIKFTSEDWTATVTYPVVLPENTIYTVTLASIHLSWFWKGTVDYDGSVTELTPFKSMSLEESQELAEEFVMNCPTYVYDGMEETLVLTDTITARCPYCWIFTFDFDSAHAGYGDRTGQVLAQVITHHQVVIAIEQLEVTSAVMDEEWDMIKQAAINGDSGQPGKILSVAELLTNPAYDTEVTIYGEMSLLGELLCPCFSLTSGEASVQVWYGLMVDNNDIEWPSVDVQGVDNGDTIMVTGELKGEGGNHYAKGDFWATDIRQYY